MARNQYFNQYTHPGQQGVYESLIRQAIKIYGLNAYYLPKTYESMDEVFRESEVNSYRQAFTIEMYLKTNLKFEGDGKFMSEELGYEIRDQMTWSVLRSRFETETGMERPREGDLVYFPLDKKTYEIKFVEHQDVFYQLGKLMVWDIQCELLEYSGEIFNTGVPEIDAIETSFNMDGVDDNSIEDYVDQGPEIQTDSDSFVDFTEIDPFSQGHI